jgi:uncharacterized spore protein YtfJ
MNLLSKTLFLAVALLIAHTSFSKSVASPADVSTYSLSPSSMSFSGVAGSVAPAPQNIKVKYVGPCDHCPPSVHATVPWIVVGKATASGYSILFAVSTNTTGLAAGTYTGKINGSSPDETPTSFTIPVTLTVKAAAVNPANVSTYSLSPSSMSFSGVAGSAAPAPQNIKVKYAGHCDHCPPTVTATVPWIVVGKATASGYSILFAVSTNTTGLAAGTYTGKINGSAPDETPTSFTIPVTLTVTAGKEYRVSLTWTGSTSPEISGYHVWRSQTSGSGFVEIGATISELSYVDSTVAAGKTYFYYVTTFGPDCPSKPTCGESKPSDKITATIPPP